VNGWHADADVRCGLGDREEMRVAERDPLWPPSTGQTTLVEAVAGTLG